MQTYKKAVLHVAVLGLVLIAVASHAPTSHAEEDRMSSFRLTITAIPTVIRQRMTGTAMTIMPRREDLRTSIMPSVNPTSIVATIRASTCNSILSSVKARESSLVESITRLVQRLSSLTEAVNTYYTNTLVPQGKTITNYSDLLNNVNTKKAAVEASIQTLKDSVTNFTCQNGEVSTQMTTYRENMQKLITSVREYTTAVKTLVSTVRPVIDLSPTRARTPSPTVSSLSPTP